MGIGGIMFLLGLIEVVHPIVAGIGFFGRGDWMAGEGTRQCSLRVGMRADYS